MEEAASLGESKGVCEGNFQMMSNDCSESSLINKKRLRLESGILELLI